MPDNFVAAMAFLSRMAPGRILKHGDLEKAVPWFGAAGLVLGCVCALGALAMCAPLLIWSDFPPVLTALVGAWAWLALEIWLSYGLHWDGLADLGDALGSCARGEAFWRIMQDSRLGAMGGLGLFMCLGGQLLGAGFHLLGVTDFRSGGVAVLPLVTLALAPAWGRLAPLWLTAYARPGEQSSLGKLVCAGIAPRTRVMSYIWAGLLVAMLAFAGISIFAIVVLACAQLFFMRRLGEVARLNGGLSGDFFGAAIELSQMLFLFCTICPLHNS